MLLQFGKGRRPLLVDFSLNVAPAFLTRSCVVVSDDPALINKLTFQKLINRPPMFGPTMFINLSVQHIFSLYISTYSESTTEIITLAAARNISIFSDKSHDFSPNLCFLPHILSHLCIPWLIHVKLYFCPRNDLYRVRWDVKLTHYALLLRCLM